MADEINKINPDQPVPETPRAPVKKAPVKATLQLREDAGRIAKAATDRRAKSAVPSQGTQSGGSVENPAPAAATKPGKQVQRPSQDGDLMPNGLLLRSADWRPDWANIQAEEGGGKVIRTANVMPQGRTGAGASNLTPANWTPVKDNAGLLVPASYHRGLPGASGNSDAGERFGQDTESGNILANFGARGTKVRAGERSSLTFKTLPEAAAYAHSLGTASAVVREGDHFAVYKLQDSRAYERDFTTASVMRSGAAPQVGGVSSNLQMLITSDGGTIDMTGRTPALAAPGTPLGRPVSLSDTESFGRGPLYDQIVGTGAKSGTISAGGRSNQTFDSRDQAIAYARGLKAGGIVVNENGEFAVYRSTTNVSRADIQAGDSGQTSITLDSSKDVVAAVTSDGAVLLANGQQPAQFSDAGTDPKTMAEVYGPGLSRLTSPADRERAQRLLNLSAQDKARSILLNTRQEIAEIKARLARGLDAGDRTAIERTLKAYAELDQKIKELEEKLAKVAPRLMALGPLSGIGGASSADPTQAGLAEYHRLQAQLQDLKQQRTDIARNNGMALLSRLSPSEAASFGGLSDDAKIAMLQGKAQEVQDGIDATLRNIGSGRLDPMTMGRVVGATAEDLGLQGLQMRWLEGQVKAAQDLDAAWKTGEAVLSFGLTAGLVLVPGGAYVRGALWAGSTAVNAHMTYEEFQNIRAVNAATDTGVSPDGGLIEREARQSWASVALGLAGFAVDLGQAVWLAREAYAFNRTARTYAQIHGVPTSQAAAALRELKQAANAGKIRTSSLDSDVFTARYGADKDAVVLNHERDGQRQLEVVFRQGLTDAQLKTVGRHEFIHLKQAGEARWLREMGLLSEQNLANWKNKTAAERLEAMAANRELEADAERRIAAGEAGPVTAEEAEAARLKAGQAEAELAQIKQAQEALRANPDAKLPPSLIEEMREPPRLFSTLKAEPARQEILNAHGTRTTNAGLEEAMDKAGVSEFGRAMVRSREAEFAKLDATQRVAVLDGIKGKSDSWIQRNLGGLIKEAKEKTQTVSMMSQITGQTAREAREVLAELQRAAGGQQISMRSMPSAAFSKQFGTAKDAAVLVRPGRLEIVFREGLAAGQLRSVGRYALIHLRQAGEAKWQADLALVSEQNLANWSAKSAKEKLDAMAASQRLRADAERRIAAGEAGAVSRADAEIASERARQAEFAVQRLARAQELLRASGENPTGLPPQIALRSRVGMDALEAPPRLGAKGAVIVPFQWTDVSVVRNRTGIAYTLDVAGQQHLLAYIDLEHKNAPLLALNNPTLTLIAPPKTNGMTSEIVEFKLKPSSGESITDYFLNRMITEHERLYGMKPASLPGWIEESNLANFKTEFARIKRENPGWSDQDVANAAARRISFGRARIKAGYGRITVDMSQFPEKVYIIALPNAPR